MNPSITKQTEKAARLLLKELPEDFIEAWYYAAVEFMAYSCGIFSRAADQKLYYDFGSGKLGDAVYQLWELYRKEKQEWTISTLWVRADGAFKFSFTYDPLGDDPIARREKWFLENIGTESVFYPPPPPPPPDSKAK